MARSWLPALLPVTFSPAQMGRPPAEENYKLINQLATLRAEGKAVGNLLSGSFRIVAQVGMGSKRFEPSTSTLRILPSSTCQCRR
jgi:hypothetical protein